MIKTGIVMCITNKKVGIMTTSGEFVYIKTSNALPNIGEVHTGELYKKTLFNYKYFITAASLMFILISSASAYAYYTPVTSIVLSINPSSVALKANRWNKIISFKAINSEGSLILNNIKLKNKSIDAGLELLVKEAKTESFINDKYLTDKKIISVDIISNKENSIDISNFKNIIDSNYLNIKINTSSANNTNIDITVNNKKIDTSNLNNPNSNKSESTNKNSNTKINPLKKPSVNINTNKVENKSSEIKKESKNSDKTNKSEDNKINKDGESENKNSSFIKRFIASNRIKNNFQDKKNKNTENMKMTDENNNSEKSFSETQEKNSSDKNSDNYENLQKNR